jgi:rhodanese-related sulfurtransferase/DNA-binding transcriptional ArsR family regulator
MDHRQFKDQLYAQFARIGQGVASPKRIELLDLLAQGPRTVEALAEECAMPVKNTSAHLRVLRQARLVETERSGTHITYRLADDAVAPLIEALQTLARRRLAEVEQVTSLYLTQRDELDPVTLTELRRRQRAGEVTVVDVRPRLEYDAAHIPGAISIPVPELKGRLRELPKRKEVIAYCRGPYCVYSVEAIGLLRRHGFRARRADQGVPGWRAQGFAIATGDVPRS